jgi:hypothetical protein
MDTKPAFLLTWKNEHWPYEAIAVMAKTFEREGVVYDPWRIIAYRQAEVGSRCFVLRQGEGDKGIFGRGLVVSEPVHRSMLDDRFGLAYKAPLGRAGGPSRKSPLFLIRFSEFSDPEREFLISDADLRTVLTPEQIGARASGFPLREGQAEALDQLIERRLEAKKVA